MRKPILVIALVLIIIAALTYGYLVLAVDTKMKEQERFKRNQPDSIRINDSTYQLRKIDSLYH